jgi:hypothetical protein
VGRGDGRAVTHICTLKRKEKQRKRGSRDGEEAEERG